MNTLKSKVTNIIRNIGRINQILPLKSRITLYNSLIASHLSYCDTVWGGCGEVNTNKIQGLQNYAAKSILNKGKYTSSSEALSKLRFLTLKEKRTLHEGIFTYKALTGKAPFVITKGYHNYLATEDNRSAMNGTLSIPKHKTSKFQQSPLYRNIITWNSIPFEIRSETSQSIFKEKLQKYTINNSYNKETKITQV